MRQNRPGSQSLPTAVSPLLALSLLLISSCGSQTQHRSLRTPAINLSQSDENVILDYQIGPTWDKSEVSYSFEDDAISVVRRTTLATAKLSVMFSTGTGFIIGEKNGQVLLATNHHVIENQAYCNETKVTFEALGFKKLMCDQVITTDTELDLTLFTLKSTDPVTTKKLLDSALPLSKDQPIKGQKLLTMGYGFAGNDRSRMMVDQGADCKTYSETGDTRYMADPDVVNPGPHKTWVFATGCDVSHGDSGSAIVDKSTGRVVGILSTGKIPKDKRVRSEEYLQKIYQDDAEDVWTELTYVVPFSKIFEKLDAFLPNAK